MAKGKIVQVIGAVVDIEFPLGELPEILNAVTIKGKSGDVDIDLVVEVMQHLGDSVTRCIAMSSTDGLTRGMEAVDTGAPITVPVGNEVLGRIFNVLGQTVDHDPTPVGNKESWPIHRPAPKFDEQETSTQVLESYEIVIAVTVQCEIAICIDTYVEDITFLDIDLSVFLVLVGGLGQTTGKTRICVHTRGHQEEDQQQERDVRH